MIGAAKLRAKIQAMKAVLKREFKIKELGAAKFMLDMEIYYDREHRVLCLRHTQSIRDVAAQINQTGAKDVHKPCELGLELSTSQSPTTEQEREEMRSKPYRSLIASCCTSRRVPDRTSPMW
jgi:transcription initiation factor IIF auxiliary subunit